MKLPNGITVSGPYYKVCHGRSMTPSLERDEWFVSKTLTKRDQKTEIQKIFGSTCLGNIVRFRNNMKRFVISQLYPTKNFSSLEKAVQFLIDNQGKLVFCT